MGTFSITIIKIILLPSPISSYFTIDQIFKFLTVQYLFSQKGGFIGPISRRVASASHGFHVGDSHTQYGQLIRFSGQGAAGRDHV